MSRIIVYCWITLEVIYAFSYKSNPNFILCDSLYVDVFAFLSGNAFMRIPLDQPNSSAG